MEFAVLAGVITMLASGIGIALTKKPVEELGALQTIVLRNLIAVPVLFIAFLAVGEPVDFSAGSMVVAVLIAILSYFPFMLFMHALKRGKVGVITPVSASRVLVSALFGFAFLGDTFSDVDIAAFTLICFGILSGSVNWSNLRHSDIANSKSGVPHALLAAMLWGVILPLFMFPSMWYGAIFWALVIEFFVLIGGTLHLAVSGIRMKNLSISKLRVNAPYIVGAACMTSVFTVFTNLGYETGEIGLVTALSGAGVIVAVLASAVFYGERLSIGQYAGATLVVLGIAITAAI